MSWILILSIYNYSSVTSQQVEFKTRNACVRAVEFIRNQNESHDYKAFCIEKDK
jgi:hypothetical protein